MSKIWKASKNQSVLLCEAPMVFKFLGCIVEEKNKNRDIACSMKTLSNLKIVPDFFSVPLVDFLKCPPLIGSSCRKILPTSVAQAAFGTICHYNRWLSKQSLKP
jgi:hypothetical protein